MKVAIVCDWLTGKGGAERVVLALSELYPDAPIYTSQYSPDKLDWFDGKDVRTGWLQKFPASIKKYLPILRVIYFSRLNLSEYDIVISSSGAEAKYVKAKKHISYLHAPTHYYWERYDQYLKHPGFGKLDWLARIGLKLFVKPLRNIDYKKAQKIDLIIANSEYDKSQIKKYYGRDSQVIHPPIDLDRFNESPITTRRKGFVVVGRQTPYKRFDLSVEACTKLALPLKVLGGGPDNNKLKSLAGPSIEFIDKPSDQQIVDALYSAEGFIFPGVDDFGIVSIEAMAAGTPVIAYKAGGALDYIVPGKTGEFFETHSVNSLVKTLEKFNPRSYDNEYIKSSVDKFSPSVFRDKISALIKENMN